MQGTLASVAGHALQLLPSGACLHLPSMSLLVADAHIGKDASFRALGIPVPAGASAGTLQRLSSDLRGTRAQALIFLGDFLHASRSKTPLLLEQLRSWRSEHADLPITLVRGNHDARAGDPPPDLGFAIVDEPLALTASEQSLPLALCHHPQTLPGRYVLAGHWHPCVNVSGPARQSLRLACFWLGDRCEHPLGILPAYGEFTGKHPIERRKSDTVYAIAGTRVQNLSRAIPSTPPNTSA